MKLNLLVIILVILWNTLDLKHRLFPPKKVSNRPKTNNMKIKQFEPNLYIWFCSYKMTGDKLILHKQVISECSTFKNLRRWWRINQSGKILVKAHKQHYNNLI